MSKYHNSIHNQVIIVILKVLTIIIIINTTSFLDRTLTILQFIHIDLVK